MNQRYIYIVQEFCSNNYLFGQVVRFKRIISNEDTLIQRLNDLKNLLVDRGYKSEKIRLDIERIY